uniref:Uncharacterized protein n=1 Tax=Brugia malayi TaxID=6279 RepID=A8P3G3_BRUMA
MKLVSAPLNNPFSVSFAQVDVTEPISGIQDANPIPEIHFFSIFIKPCKIRLIVKKLTPKEAAKGHNAVDNPEINITIANTVHVTCTCILLLSEENDKKWYHCDLWIEYQHPENIPEKKNEKKSWRDVEQRGAVEACWAHNPEVGGSKPLAAIGLLKLLDIIVKRYTF